MKSFYTLILLLIPVVFLSCEKEKNADHPSPLDNQVKLAEGYAQGAAAKIQIWGDKNFFAGYNALNVVILDSNDLSQKIMNSHIHFEPEMTMNTGMMMHTHSTPVENPDEEAVDGVFPGAIIFIMPSSDGETWKLNLHLHNHSNGLSGEASFDIQVDNPDHAEILSFISQTSDSSKLFLSLVKPHHPEVGTNDIEFTIHKMESMEDFVSMDDYTIELEPEMPSMGHGSPNNVDPVGAGNGHYAGKVNFTMTGWWRINLTIKKEGEIVADGLYFEINL